MATYKFCDGSGNTLTTEVTLTTNGYYTVEYSSSESDTTQHQTDLIVTADRTVTERLKINYTYQLRTKSDNNDWGDWMDADGTIYIEAGNDSATKRVLLDEHVCWKDSSEQ